MKITRTLKVTETEFFDYLENDLITSILESNQRELKARDIKKGLRYSKNADNTYSRLDISIEEYVRGDIYKSKIKSMGDMIVLSYETTPVENGLQVVFQQYIDSFEKKKQNKLMHMFSEAVYYGRMSDTLFDIQKKIINIREGVIEKKPSKSPEQHKLLKKMVAKKD